MHRLTVTALTILLLSGSLAFAQSPGRAKPSGAPEEQNACYRDANRFCADAIPDQMKVLACLKEHRNRLTKGCQQVLTSNGQ